MVKKTLALAIFSALIASTAFAGISKCRNNRDGRCFGNLELRGRVAEICAMNLDPTVLSQNLDLDQQLSDVHVATITEVSNSLNGYTVFAESANQGKLIHVVDHNSVINYDVTYGGSGPISLGVAGPVVLKEVPSLSGFSAVSEELRISTAGPGSVAGTYTDVVTLTVANND